MRVVVDHHVVGRVILHLEAPGRAAELGQRADDLVPGDAQLRRERNDAERVGHVLRAGNLQRHLAEQLALLQHGEARGKILQPHIERAVARHFGNAVADACAACEQSSIAFLSSAQ